MLRLFQSDLLNGFGSSLDLQLKFVMPFLEQVVVCYVGQDQQLVEAVEWDFNEECNYTAV